MDKCKLLYNDRIESNIVSNKNNKQLNNKIKNKQFHIEII